MNDWTQIGHLTGYTAGRGGGVWIRPHADITPGEIETCDNCCEHARDYPDLGLDLHHMQAFHVIHTLPASRPGDSPAPPTIPGDNDHHG